MNGVEALRAVLVGSAALTELVPADAIVEGVVPKGALPAISLDSISIVDLNVASPGPTRFVRERVRATVAAPSNDQRTDILAAIKHAAADVGPVVVAGLRGVTIHTDGTGPSTMNEGATIYIRSQYFLIKYTEER